MNKLRVGIVGCGHVANTRHIPAFLKLRNKAEIVALCDLNEEMAKKASNRFQIKKYYTNLDIMIKKEKLDIVDICTPPNTHKNITIRALEEDTNVLLEKPMAPSVEDCNKMIQVAENVDKKLSIVHNQLFYPPFLKAKKIVKSGKVGEISGIAINQFTNSSRYLMNEDHWIHKLPGGFFGETGPHVIYMSLEFLKTVKKIHVTGKKIHDLPWTFFDEYRIILEGSECNSSIIVSHANDYHLSDISIFGERNMLKMDLQSMVLSKYSRKNLTYSDVAGSTLNIAKQTAMGVVNNILKVVTRQPMLGHDILVDRYIDSIINDTQPPVTAYEGRNTIKVMGDIIKEINKLALTKEK